MKTETILSKRFTDAIVWAAALHAGQFRKGTTIPFLVHPLAVAGLVLEHGGDEDAAIAALLHDAPEDCGGQPVLDEIRERFGNRVAGFVAECSEPLTLPKPTWEVRKACYINNLRIASPVAALISCCDKLHNVRSILAELDESGLSVFDRFTTGRAGTLWFYSTVCDVLREKNLPTPLFRELSRCVDRLQNPAV